MALVSVLTTNWPKEVTVDDHPLPLRPSVALLYQYPFYFLHNWITRLLYDYAFYCVHQSIQHRISKRLSFRDVPIQIVIAYFHYTRNWSPFTSFVRTGAKSLRGIERDDGALQTLIDWTSTNDWTCCFDDGTSTPMEAHPIEIQAANDLANIIAKDLALDGAMDALSSEEDEDDHDDSCPPRTGASTGFTSCSTGCGRNCPYSYVGDETGNPTLMLMKFENGRALPWIDIGTRYVSTCIAANYSNFNNMDISFQTRLHNRVIQVTLTPTEIIIRGGNASLRYCKRSHKFTCKGCVAEAGIAQTFYDEFGIEVPILWFMDITTEKHPDTGRVVSNLSCRHCQNFIMYDHETKDYFITWTMMKKVPDSFKWFQQHFGLKLPIDDQRAALRLYHTLCANRRKQKKQKKLPLREFINKVLGSILTKYQLGLVLSCDSPAKVERFHAKVVCPRDNGCDDRVLVAYSLDFTASDLARQLHQELKHRRLRQPPKSPLSLTTLNGIYASYALGPQSTTIVTTSSSSVTFNVTDLSTGRSVFEGKLNNNEKKGELVIDVANPDYYDAKTNELIGWKLVTFEDGRDGLAKVRIPAGSHVFPNDDGHKLRSNRLTPEQLYKPLFYACYECKKNCALYMFDHILYCTGCATIIAKRLLEHPMDPRRLSLADFCSVGYETTEIGCSPTVARRLEYRAGVEMVEDGFEAGISRCDKKGLYFFLGVEHAVAYSNKFAPTLIQSIDPTRYVPCISLMKFTNDSRSSSSSTISSSTISSSSSTSSGSSDGEGKGEQSISISPSSSCSVELTPIPALSSSIPTLRQRKTTLIKSGSGTTTTLSNIDDDEGEQARLLPRDGPPKSEKKCTLQ